MIDPIVIASAVGMGCVCLYMGIDWLLHRHDPPPPPEPPPQPRRPRSRPPRLRR